MMPQDIDHMWHDEATTDQPTLRDSNEFPIELARKLVDSPRHQLTPDLQARALAEIDRLTAELTTLRADMDAVAYQLGRADMAAEAAERLKKPAVAVMNKERQPIFDEAAQLTSMAMGVVASKEAEKLPAELLFDEARMNEIRTGIAFAAAMPKTDALERAREAAPDCRFCGGQGRFQIVSPVSDHAWANCFCTKPAIASIDTTGEKK